MSHCDSVMCCWDQRVLVVGRHHADCWCFAKGLSFMTMPVHIPSLHVSILHIVPSRHCITRTLAFLLSMPRLQAKHSKEYSKVRVYQQSHTAIQPRNLQRLDLSTQTRRFLRKCYKNPTLWLFLQTR